MSTETRILLALMAVLALCIFACIALSAPPILTAVCVGLIVTAMLYRFLGGVEGASFKVTTFKAGGGVAVMAIATLFVNGELVKRNPLIDPSPESWVALDRNGAFTPVTIGGTTYSPDVSTFLRDAVWHADDDSGLIRVMEGNYGLASLDFESLGRLGLFDWIEMSQDKGIQFTGELTAGAEYDLLPVYPFKVRATQFKDEYNGFDVLDAHDRIVFSQGLLRTRNFQLFEYVGEHYLIFVSRARHNDPNKEPWAVFGFTQVDPILSRQHFSD